MNPNTIFANYFTTDKQIRPYLYTLALKMSQGHICMDLNASPESEDQMVENILPITKEKLLNHHLISEKKGEPAPFVMHNHKLYTTRFFNYETHFLSDIIRLSGSESLSENMKMAYNNKPLITQLFRNKDLQMAAVLLPLIQNFTIITGGPGTGKTTTIAKLLVILFSINPQINVLMAAPTGKAAIRMQESLNNISESFEREQLKIEHGIIEKILNIQPTTIHQMLGYQKDSLYFKHNDKRPLKADVVIIDESSMIDLALFSKLLNAIPDQSKLIILGDKNQLSSVEAGSIFGDLCAAINHVNTFTPEISNFFNQFEIQLNSDEKLNPESIQNHIIELQKSYRFDDSGGIGKFSKAIINNRPDEIIQFIENDDPQLNIIQEYNEQIISLFVPFYKDYILEKETKKALQLINNFKILCAVKKGTTGIYAINMLVEKLLSDQELLFIHNEFYENRLILVTKNQPELGLYNGDMGIIRTNNNGEKRAFFLDGSGELFDVLPTQINQLETSYAITIHKSQGSEYNQILVILPTMEQLPILTRELIYTAVTRAKHKATIICNKNVLIQATSKTVNRISGIIERLQNN